MRVGLSAYLAMWSVDLVRRRARSESGEDPRCVLIRREDHRREVVQACCAEALRAGVRPGMTIAHARALLPADPLVRAHDPEGDARALRALGQRLCERVPIVALDGPDGLLMDASGCERLFGGHREIAREVRGAIAELGFTVRVALAPSLAGARALARHGGGVLVVVGEGDLEARVRTLPVEALPVEGEAIAALREMGFARVGEVMDLPRSDLPARFGDDLLLGLDRMLGRAIEPISGMRPVEEASAERVFDGPVADLGVVHRVLRGLLEELSSRLRARELGVTGLGVRIARADLPTASLTIPLSGATRDAGHLWRLLEARLEGVSLGSGVEWLRVSAKRTSRLPHEQRRAWEREDRGRDLAGLVDTLCARLGRHRVRRVVERETRWPDRRFTHEALAGEARRRPVRSVGRLGDGSGRREPGGERRASERRGIGRNERARTDREVGVPTDRPSLVFDRPIACDVVLRAPDGPPLRVRWRGASRGVRACVGPERIAAEWWRDDGGTRDYFRVCLDDGTWLWLCRENDRWLARGEWA